MHSSMNLNFAYFYYSIHIQNTVKENLQGNQRDYWCNIIGITNEEALVDAESEVEEEKKR